MVASVTIKAHTAVFAWSFDTSFTEGWWDSNLNYLQHSNSAPPPNQSTEQCWSSSLMAVFLGLVLPEGLFVGAWKTIQFNYVS